MNEKVYLSQEGKQKLEEKLRYLVETERPQVVERLKIDKEIIINKNLMLAKK